MAMNRRNVLIGLGAVAVGGGAAFGSGAFSQVSAERTMNISVANDANALLGLEVANDYGQTTGGEIQIDLDSALPNASGINSNALTELGGVLRVINQGSDNGVSLSFSISNDGSTTVVDVGSVTDGNDEIGIGFTENTGYTYTSGDGFTPTSGNPDGVPLDTTQDTVYNLELDTRGSTLSGGDSLTITVTIDATS